jgi:hypothetical protein
MIGKKSQGRWLLGREEGPGVTALREVNGCSCWKCSSKCFDARVEGIVIARRNSYR